MSRRVVILTEIIAPYRIPVFNALTRLWQIDLHVIFLSKTDSTTRQWHVYEGEIQFSYEVLPSWRRRIGKYHVLLNHDVYGALRQSRPDVIVCGGYNYLASWQAIGWARQNQVPFLLWSESTASDQRSRHLVVETLKRKFIENCCGFIVPGQSARHYLFQLGVPSEKIFLARNAVDIDLFSGSGKLARARPERRRAELALPERYFLYVGRLVHPKGVSDLLEAYALLPAALRTHVGLVFAGNGPMRASLEARAREIYPGSVLFAGFVHRDELVDYYALAECLVFPTHSDPWGLVVNEAMACGLPVICSQVAGCAPDLIHGNGVLVAPGDARRLADAMQQLAMNEDLRQLMSHESEDLIRSYSPEICAAGILEATLTAEAIGE